MSHDATNESVETFPVKIYKVTLMIADHDELGEGQIKNVLENARYPNHCINPRVMEIEGKETAWHDNHPLNSKIKGKEAFKELFSE